MSKRAQLEETTGLIYREFARSKQCEPALTEIWLAMAGDEVDHVQQLLLAMRLFRNNIGEKNNSLRVNPDELIALANNILAKARNDEYEIPRMQSVAVFMEDSFLKIHATNAVTFNDPNLLLTFKGLALADELHVKRLIAYIMQQKNLDHYDHDLCKEERCIGAGFGS